VSELVVIEQRRGDGHDASFWVREGDQRLPGRDSDARLIALRAGLRRHAGVRSLDADAADATVARTLCVLHERRYLEALAGLDSDEPVVMPEFAPPGLEPDIPVNAGLVAAAREGVRTAISAAQRTLAGAEFTYAVCRPPGHHAGPAFHAGYCYLNNAGAAVRTLLDGGLAPVGVLDLDLHYPNGTSALLERLPERNGAGPSAVLHSLHAAPVTNVPAGTELPRLAGERALAFEEAPDADAYVAEVAASVEDLAASVSVLVVSLGYDTVEGDPHGGWRFEPAVFERIGAVLAACGRPVCVVQEGGYAVDALAECAHAFATGLLGDRGRPAGRVPDQRTTA
jgi:acetoin utilization deacetylase AcuC-like enzyme